MRKLLNRGVAVGLGLASLATKTLRKNIRMLEKEGLVTKKEASVLLKKALSEANKERDRVFRFVKAEIKRVRKK